MNRKTKVWLITAAFLVLVGCILFAVVMTSLGWDFTKLSTVEYVTNIYKISEGFDSISVDTDTADIVFAVSDKDKCTVDCYEEENAKHSVTVENNVLVIKINNKKSLIEYIGINFGSPKIKVYLPKAEYASLTISENTGDIEIPKDFTFKSADISLSTGDVKFCASVSEKVKIKASTGDISVKNASVGALDLTVSTGDITVSDINCSGDIKTKVTTGETGIKDTDCQSFISEGTTGDLYLDGLIAEEKFSIKRSTGDVELKGCDAAKISIETSTGDVEGSLLTEKIFITQTDTGEVDVPKSTSGGRCEISTDTGDIEIVCEN